MIDVIYIVLHLVRAFQKHDKWVFFVKNAMDLWIDVLDDLIDFGLNDNDDFDYYDYHEYHE